LFSDIIVLPDIDGVESRSLAKGLKLLETLAGAVQPLSLGELAASIDLGKPSALRLIRTLSALRMIQRIEGERYTLSFPWPARRSHLLVELVRQVADAPMRRLNAELGETVALAYLHGDLIRVVSVVESSHHIRMSNYPDRILQPYASSLGKAIAAFLPRQQAQRLLDVYGIYPLTATTITELAAIRDEFERVRKSGYAEDREETVAGGMCVGAPIATPEGNVIASLSVSTPKARYTERYAEQLPALLIGEAQKIAEGLASSLTAGEPG